MCVVVVVFFFGKVPLENLLILKISTFIKKTNSTFL